MSERATLGVDGDHAFAHLGENIQEGESVFVKIECDEPTWTKAYNDEACRAATKALNLLREKVGREISYYIGPSHPRHC